MPITDILLTGEPPTPIVVRRIANGRRLSLRIDRISGRVYLTVPDHLRMDEARRFVRDRQDWITRNLQDAVQRRVPAFGDSFPLEGRSFEIHKAGGSRIRCRDSLLLAPCTDAKLPAALGEFCRSLARERLLARTRHHADTLSLPHPAIRLRDTRSRWGSCSSDNRLMFSWRLVMAPPEVLDYVAAHEVSHLAELNHSKRFWQIVERLCPDYLQHRQWLRQNGVLLHQHILD